MIASIWKENRNALLTLGFLFFGLLVAGYDYLFGMGFDVCLFKNITGKPCPACGMTHAAHALLEGDLIHAWQWHPFIFIAIPFAIVAGYSSLSDLLNPRQRKLPHFFNYLDGFPRKHPIIATTLLIGLLIRWAIKLIENA